MQNTYVLLCDFRSQDGLEQLINGGPELVAQAAALGEELDDVDVPGFHLTRNGVFDVVMIVTAPTDDRAREVLTLFDDMGDVDTTVLTVTGEISAEIVQAFNAHTKM